MIIKIWKEPADYLSTINDMEILVQRLKEDRLLPGHLWFLEHPALYTEGIGTKDKATVGSTLQIIKTNRGGQHTYHGPGQLIVYCVAPLEFVNNDIRRYIEILLNWIVRALRKFSIESIPCYKKIGVWVFNPHNNRQEKIAALGLRVSRGVAYHGFSLNYAVDLEAYRHIVPCGLINDGVTSMKELGINTTFQNLICALIGTVPKEFFSKTAH